MAQRIEPFKDCSTDNENHSSAIRARVGNVAQTRFPTSPPENTLCEKTQGMVRYLTSKHHLDEASKQPFQFKLQACGLTLRPWLLELRPRKNVP